MRFHIHYDPDWQLVGVWRYYECKCGARKVERAYANLLGPSSRNWPGTFDRHGQSTDSSGWQHGYTGPIGQDMPKLWSPPSAGLRTET